PVQIVAATITSDADDYAQEVAEALGAQGLRVETDLRNEKITYKVREHSLAKVPILLALGKREAEQRTVSLRRLGSSEIENLPLDDAAQLLSREALGPQHQSPHQDIERREHAAEGIHA